MPKSRPGDSDLSEYAMVADRITLFYQRYPTGRIITDLHSRTEREITFVAHVFRGPEDTKPAATGWACFQPACEICLGGELTAQTAEPICAPIAGTLLVGVPTRIVSTLR